MTTPLLTTKLYIPPPRPNLVPRACLIGKLGEGPAVLAEQYVRSSTNNRARLNAHAGEYAMRTESAFDTPPYPMICLTRSYHTRLSRTKTAGYP